MIEFSETGHLRGVYLDLLVSLLRVLHAKRLECEKSMKLMASFHRSHLCWSRWDSSAVVALLDFPVGSVEEGTIKTLTPYPNMVCVSATAWDGSLGRFNKDIWITSSTNQLLT